MPFFQWSRMAFIKTKYFYLFITHRIAPTDLAQTSSIMLHCLFFFFFWNCFRLIHSITDMPLSSCKDWAGWQSKKEGPNDQSLLFCWILLSTLCWTGKVTCVPSTPFIGRYLHPNTCLKPSSPRGRKKEKGKERKKSSPGSRNLQRNFLERIWLGHWEYSVRKYGPGLEQPKLPRENKTEYVHVGRQAASRVYGRRGGPRTTWKHLPPSKH